MSYLSLTPMQAVYLGGSFYNESTSSEKTKCVTYSQVGGPWFSQHGLSYRNVSGFNANETTRIIPVNDVYYTSSSSYTSSDIITVTDYDVPIATFVRYSTGYLEGQYSYMQGQTSGGSASTEYLMNNSGGVWSPYGKRADPLYLGGSSYISGGTYTIGGEDFLVTFEGTTLYPDGKYPYGDNNMLYGSRTLFSINNYVVVDFAGWNCKNAYFTYIVGGNEGDVVYCASGHGTPPNHPDMAFGWSVPVGKAISLDSYKQLRYMDNNGYNVIAIPSNKSVDFVYVTNAGFSIVFKNTTQKNNKGYELFAVLSNYNSTDNEYLSAVIIEVRNFNMS